MTELSRYRRVLRSATGFMLLVTLAACVSRRPPSIVIQPSQPSVQAQAYAHYLNGLAYIRENNRDAALIEFEEVLRLDPTAARAATTLATLYRIGNRNDEALALLEKTVSAGARNPNVHIMLDMMYRIDNRPDDALAVLENAVDSGIESADLRMRLADMYQQMSRHDDAEEQLRTAAKLTPGNAAPYLYLGNLMTGNNDLVAAVEAYRQAAVLQPKSGLVQQKLGLTYTLMRRHDLAVEALRLAGELEPGISDANAYNLGLVLIEKGDLDEAERPLHIALGREPKSVRVRRTLAGLYCRTERWDDAEEQYAAIDTLTPGSARVAQERATLQFLAGRYLKVIDTLKSLGNEFSDDAFTRFLNACAEWKLGRHDVAATHIREIPTLWDQTTLDVMLSVVKLFGEPRSAETFSSVIKEISNAGGNSETVHLLHGRLLEMMDDKEAALDAMNQATAINPGGKLGHFFAGAICGELDRQEEAVDHLKKALELDPDDPEINNHLGYTYAELDTNIDEAHAMLLKALKTQPDNGYFLDSMGWIFYRKGQLDRALDHIRRALPKMATDDAIVRDHLGDILSAMGRDEEALVEWQKAAMLDPEMESVQEKIKAHTPAR